MTNYSEADYRKSVSILKEFYLFFLPWLIYVLIGLVLELLGVLFFPRSPTSLWTILYYSLAVPHGLLLISLVSVVLIKSISLSKTALLHFWKSYTPPFNSELNISTDPEPTTDLIQRAQKYGVWFLPSGYLLGTIIPLFGEVPLRYGTILYTELPEIPYTETISEIIFGFPIVGDLFILNFITVQSTILYIPISISIFAMLVGCWNLSYASKHFLKENVGEDGRKQRKIYKIVAILNAPLIIVYAYIVL
jgi:Flp pilus assembly pilin Flp